MDDKSLEMLEFPRIRQMIAELTSFSTSRELADFIRPLNNYEQISLLLRQSAEARHLLSEEPGFSVGFVKDFRDSARMAALGSILEPKTLLEIHGTLVSMRELRVSIARVSAELPLLWSIAKGIVELQQVEKDIADCLDPSGEVRDSASPELANIRNQLRDIRGQLLSQLEAMIKAPGIRKILQEDIITERDGRYVILVKTECRHEIKGIIHDISNTGVTLFVEPAITIGLGNALRELAVEEKHEIERILGALSAKVGEHEAEISRSIELTAEIDLALAKAKFARKVNAVEPVITDLNTVDAQRTKVLKLIEARHPLLPGKAVPLTVEIGRDYSILLITGPNTGGKTVAAKSIGLLTLMTQSGIPIPASAESVIPVFDSVFSDIGDEQSIEQTLSTFSWHMGNIIRIINEATENSLILLDELGTSTDPAEGSALARAILRYFLSRSMLIVVTTHYGDLKVFAHMTRGMQNASLDFDPVTLMPTYHLTIGIPGGSNALATASRLGLPAEIIDDARQMLSGGSQELETLLAHIMEEKQKAEEIRHNLEKERSEVARRNAELEEMLEQAKDQAKRTVQENRDKIIREAAELHKAIREAQSELRKEKSKERIEQARKVLTAIEKQMESGIWKPEEGQAGEELSEEGGIRVGDVVWLKESNVPATVLAVFRKKNQVEAQAGAAKVTIGLDKVERVASRSEIKLARSRPVSLPATKVVSPQLDLRGKRADDVEPILDSYLSDAVLSNLSEVRIVHGFGTGTVRNIVRDFLAAHPMVKAFRSGRDNEGGDGVTIVSL